MSDWVFDYLLDALLTLGKIPRAHEDGSGFYLEEASDEEVRAFVWWLEKEDAS